MIKSKITTLFLIITYCSILNLIFRSAVADSNQDTTSNTSPAKTTKGLLATTDQMIDELILQVESQKNTSKELKANVNEQQKKNQLSKKKNNKSNISPLIPSHIPPAIAHLIRSKQVSIGISKEHVLLSWGKPRNINKSIGGWGVHEQWVYPNRYLYFENGILTSFQTSD